MRTTQTVFILSVILLLSALVTKSPAATPSAGLRITLTNKSDSKSKQIEVTVSNASNRSIHLLSWTLPLNGEIRDDIFEVKDSRGRRMDYLGKQTKSLPPGKEDYLSLPTGAQYRCLVELPKLYDMDGDRDVRFDGYMNYYLSDDFDLSKPAKSERIISETIHIEANAGLLQRFRRWLFSSEKK